MTRAEEKSSGCFFFSFFLEIHFVRYINTYRKTNIYAQATENSFN